MPAAGRRLRALEGRSRDSAVSAPAFLRFLRIARFAAYCVLRAWYCVLRIASCRYMPDELPADCRQRMLKAESGKLKAES
jgi:hypothetical protein